MVRARSIRASTALALAAAALPLAVPACAASDGDGDTAAEASEALTASATLLVSADFASNSTTKGIVSSEITNDANVKLVAVGDLSYTSPYASNYPWASWTGRTFPVMGNHEFDSVSGKGGQQPYDLFDGKNAAGNLRFPAITGANGVATYDFTYSYEVAPGWLLVVLNTNVANSARTDCAIQPCSTQAQHLTSTVTNWRNAHGGKGCVVVAMHTARFSSMFSSSTDNEPWTPTVDAIWKAAVGQQVDVVLQSHAHVYEEFPKLGAGGCNAATGTKLFTVGSGGRGQVQPTKSNLTCTTPIVARPSPVNGVLKLALYDGSYGYRFETSATTTEPASKIACNR